MSWRTVLATPTGGEPSIAQYSHNTQKSDPSGANPTAKGISADIANIAYRVDCPTAPAEPYHRWLIHLPDGTALEVDNVPPATIAELREVYGEDITAEPLEPGEILL